MRLRPSLILPRALLLIMAVGATAFLQACSLPGVAINRAPAAYAPVEGQTVGYLVASVGARRAWPLKNGLTSNTLIYRAVGAEKRALLQFSNGNWPFVESDYKDDDSFGKVIVIPLKPGRYEFFDASFFFNNGTVSKSWSAKEPFSIPFAIKPGQATYLGEFLSYGRWAKNMFGISIPAGGVFVRNDEQARDWALAKQLEPAVASARLRKADLSAVATPFVVTAAEGRFMLNAAQP